MQSANMTKKEESKGKMHLTDMENDGENHQRLNWLSDNREQRKKKETYTLEWVLERRNFCGQT